MKHFLCIGLLLLLTVFVNAQTPSNLLWGTYFGGSSDEMAYGMATDAEGDIYVAGSTTSLNGIDSVGAFQTTFGGGQTDAFLAKFNSQGDLLWSTYFGGSDLDYALAVAADANGNVYIAGYTYSITGIASHGAFDTTQSASYYCGFLAKFDSAGSRLWGTYYGSGSSDVIDAINIDDKGNVYITGYE